MKKQEELIHEELEYCPSLCDLPVSEYNNLYTSIIKVMEEVKNIDKSMTVGEGKNSYKGVSDKDVKYAIGRAMSKHGLTCIPIDIKPTTRIDRWTEMVWDSYKKENVEKTKQSVFVEVVATYKITYAATGESINIVGYGHGVDSQDKAAGKATTYALKNALLYSFLVPTGSIDDTDNTHSNNIETPKNTKPKFPQDRFENGLAKVTSGELAKDKFIKALEGYELSEVQKGALMLL